MIRIRLETGLGMLAEAIATGREGLAIIGVRLPGRPGTLSVLREHLGVRWQMGRRTIPELVELPELGAQDVRSVMKLLMALAPVALFVDTVRLTIVLMRIAAAPISRTGPGPLPGLSSSSSAAASCPVRTDTPSTRRSRPARWRCRSGARAAISTRATACAAIARRRRSVDMTAMCELVARWCALLADPGPEPPELPESPESLAAGALGIRERLMPASDVAVDDQRTPCAMYYTSMLHISQPGTVTRDPVGLDSRPNSTCTGSHK